MLTKITNNLYINLADVYLVDSYTWDGGTLIYINQFDKIPIELKDSEAINNFNLKLTKYLSRKEKHNEQYAQERPAKNE